MNVAQHWNQTNMTLRETREKQKKNQWHEMILSEIKVVHCSVLIWMCWLCCEMWLTFINQWTCLLMLVNELNWCLSLLCIWFNLCFFFGINQSQWSDCDKILLFQSILREIKISFFSVWIGMSWLSDVEAVRYALLINDHVD